MIHPVEAEQFDGKKVELCSTLATKGTFDKLSQIIHSLLIIAQLYQTLITKKVL